MGKHLPLSNKILFALFVATALFAFNNPAQAKVFNAKDFTLDNGLQVIVITNNRAPVVAHTVWYKVGAADEPQGLSGMAHYFEHLMFKGTEKIPPGEFSRIIKKLGGEHNAFTSQDYTAYYEVVATEHLEKMMEMEADRMVNLSVPKEHFDSEKKVVLEERRQRTDNNPENRFYEQMRNALYTNHPYGTPVIGWMEEIKSYEWEDVKQFYDTWYAPNNAIVVISGNVTVDEVKPMAERTYGLLKPKDLPKRIRPKIPPAFGETLMTLKHKSIGQPTLQQAFLAPNQHAYKHESLALTVLQEILSGGATTRLYKKLVVEEKKAISVGISYSNGMLDYGTIWVYGTPTKETSLAELEDLIHKEIKNVIENGVTKTEVKEAIQRLQDGAIYARDSLRGPAMTFGNVLTAGGSIDDIEDWSDNIGTITAKDVQDVAAKYINIETPWIRLPVTGHLLPPDEKKPEEEKKK